MPSMQFINNKNDRGPGIWWPRNLEHTRCRFDRGSVKSERETLPANTSRRRQMQIDVVTSAAPIYDIFVRI